MRIILFVALFGISGCSSLSSLWPFGKDKETDCVKDNSCEVSSSAAREEAKKIWACQGISKEQGWNCVSSNSMVPKPEVLNSDKNGNHANPDSFSHIFSDYEETAYAVQIAALKSREEIITLATKLEMKSPLILETELEGSIWYVLILGIFNEIDAAKAAAINVQVTDTSMPEPWIRPIESLKKALAPSGG